MRHKRKYVAKRRRTPPKKIVIETTVQVEDDLYRLVDTGLFGSTIEECTEQLLRERVRQLKLEGWIDDELGDEPQARRRE